MDAPHSAARDARRRAGPTRIRRWECHCTQTPVLLGIYDVSGSFNIKIRDRYWRVTRGEVETVCPKCGSRHALDLDRLREAGPVPA